MKLSDLLGASVVSTLRRDPEIWGLTADSRAVKSGFLFAAIQGETRDGRAFIPQAVENGAVAILTHELTGEDAPTELSVPVDAPEEVAVVRAANPRARLAEASARFFYPGPKAQYAVTGTNGKTSTAWFAAQLFQGAGRKAASLGTLGACVADGSLRIPLGHTTPDPVTFHAAFAALRDAGVDAVIVEASSHGLVQNRLDGVSFDGAAFSNITQDHLDYHADFNAYFNAKARLFAQRVKSNGFCVVNVDGAGAEKMAAVAAERGLATITTGAEGADVRLLKCEPALAGLNLAVEALGVMRTIDVPVIGAFQAENAMLAAGLAIGAGVPVSKVFDSLAGLCAPPGRMQLAGEDAGRAGYVDYAHTPDAVAAALRAIRPHTAGRVVAIVGAGGDRDADKRPKMGAAAADGADCVIVTDDNPRSENPALIRRAVLEGARSGGAEVREIGDRADAIRAGVDLLAPGDVLLVLGKGHETGQIIGDRTLPFDDAESVKAAFEERKGRS
ncbi:MAG: UDP-N-acetylmuramoyl-L-alanyl-D-glutamate--2,6-diaminopimelate ligase [Pseudomonadota bacterium]